MADLVTAAATMWQVCVFCTWDLLQPGACARAAIALHFFIFASEILAR